MAKGKTLAKVDTSRDPGGFVALPWSVMDSAAYKGLNHAAVRLLLEICRQYVKDNNGRLLASEEYLRSRGVSLAGDTITRAKRELIDAGFIYETCKGGFPNKASWYALTFYSIDRLSGYDPGALESFPRGAYRKNASLTPTIGVESAAIAPTIGVETPHAAPTIGATEPVSSTPLAPTIGDHLEIPSPAVSLSAAEGKGKDAGGPESEAKPPARHRRKRTDADQLGSNA